MNVDQIDFQGMALLRLRAAPYEAWVAPSMGGNVIRLYHGGLGMEVLRVPPSPSILRNSPNVFGAPPLFPPNRIRGGSFSFDGQAYRFPVNEPERGNSLHGALSATAMRVEAMGESAYSEEITLSYEAGEPYSYMNFPHVFSYRVAYGLSPEGLTQTVRFRNLGSSRMPFGFGLHTAFAIPRERGENYRVCVPVETQWRMDPATALPTGETAVGTEEHFLLNDEGVPPLSHPVSGFYRRLPGPVRIRDIVRGAEIRYDVDDGFRFWMLWNAGAERNFICVEPMTWMVDAPNLSLPWAESGMDAIARGETKSLMTRLSAAAIG